MELFQIERRSGLTREEFTQSYLQKKRPVVFTDLSGDWPATTKWTFDYLQSEHGHLDVPLIGPDYHKAGQDYMKSRITMKFGDYLDLIRQGPTPYRIFLWNIFEHARDLVDDLHNPGIADGWIDQYPFMFFGGAGAVTSLHYDMDCSHVFHTHFQTRKRIVLFSPAQSRLLYQHPFTVQSRVDPLRPDYERYPALRRAKGFETTLTHGETLFIPALWWHHIVYLDPGFSISLRTADSIFTRAKGLWNLSRHFTVDKGMNALWGQRWMQWKEETAARRAENAMISG